ncbi:acyl-CoA dehydrogenase [Mycobacterium seoulense]|uniref:acyl-CoA dehydrogenase n=1 Tax=Mycobacterium seoulense TaxID=386911 RepID=UPI003CF01D8D
MNYMPDESAESLREIIHAFLAKFSTEQDVRNLMGTSPGYDAPVWHRLSTELGLTGLAIPEEHGGSGAGPVEVGIAFEEMGRKLFCAPFLSTVGLVATAIVESGNSEACRDFLPAIVSGDRTATLVWEGPSPTKSQLRIQHKDAGWTVSGRVPVAVEATAADFVLVAGASADGPVVGVVESTAPGLAIESLTPLDQTRPLASVQFNATPVRLVCSGDDAIRSMTRTYDLALLYVAAEQLGASARQLELAVEYAKTRTQFGRAIGSFQAIKHRCADMLVAVESARSVVYHGLWMAANYGPADSNLVSQSASLAKAVASECCRMVALQTLQIHGGIGFTWEHSAHLYVKRAKSTQLLFGSPSYHRARLAGLLGIGHPDQTERSIGAGDGQTPVMEDQTQDHTDAEALAQAVADFLGKYPVPHPDDRMGDRKMREARFDAGLALVSLPEGLGGRSLDPTMQQVVDNAFAAAGADDHEGRNTIGLGMALPTIAEHGTAEQKARYLRPCFSGEEIWCQLFSEPGAGSDLASLSTRAVLNGDAYVVNGQKVWTSLGHVASWAILLARTDVAAPKHRGLTYFLVDMRSPGVEVRPLRQITGEAEFNEVYLTDVRIPVANVLGRVNDGWRVAMTTLANERVALGARIVERGTGPIRQLLDIYGSALAREDVGEEALDRVMLLWSRAEAARLTNIRASRPRDQGPGPEGSIAKLQMAELNQAIYECCVDLCGSDGLQIDGYDYVAPEYATPQGRGDVRKVWLRSLANSIEGGTSEIMRNILGERILGLPPEPRLDKNTAWIDSNRS